MLIFSTTIENRLGIFDELTFGRKADEIDYTVRPGSYGLVVRGGCILTVQAGYRNRGIGATLIRSVCNEAERRGQHVEVEVLRANDAARRLYERLGFEICETDHERHHLSYCPRN